MTSWPYNEWPAGFSLPDYGLGDEDHRKLTERIWSSLVVGADDVDDFIDAESGEWSLTDDQLRDAFQLTRQVRLQQQTQWTAEETRTNLDRAFDELNSVGILARQNFSCCGTCGAAEIGDERDDSQHWRGYVFYHQQDTESLIDSGSVYLGYGIFAPKDFDRAAYELLSDEEKSALYVTNLRRFVSEEVNPRLASHGLDVVWNGDHRTRILLRQAQWYTRLDG